MAGAAEDILPSTDPQRSSPHLAAAIEAKGLVSVEAAERFGAPMRQRFVGGDTPARKVWIGAVIDRIEVDDGVIRILGRKDVLEQAVLAEGGFVPGVRSLVRKWRTGQDETANSYVIEIAI